MAASAREEIRFTSVFQVTVDYSLVFGRNAVDSLTYRHPPAQAKENVREMSRQIIALVITFPLISAGCMPGAHNTSGSSGQREEKPLPEPREETAAATLNGKLFVLGGFDANGHDTDTVFVYENGWSYGPHLPMRLDHAAAAGTPSGLYVAGGFSGGRARSEVYRLSGNRWQRVASLHHARGALALVALSNHLYAVGGNSQDTQEEIPEVYDPIQDLWTELTPMPMPRNHLAGFAYSGMVCVAGGRPPNTARVDCLRPGTGMWTRLTDLPEATSGAGAAALDDQIVVAGGEGENIVDQLARFYGRAWHVEVMILPRHGFQLAVLAGRAWACGGGASPGLDPTDQCTSIAKA